MLTKEMRKIAIIGFGGGGLTLFVQLVDKLIEKRLTAEIHVYDAHKFGRGQAYSTDTMYHILNLDTHTMSIAHTKKDHFYKWFKNNRKKWQTIYPAVSVDDPYPPRAIFGLYMDDVYDDYKQLAATHGIGIVEHNVLVSDAIKCAQGYEVVAKDGTLSVDSIVLALGNMPSDKFDEFKNHPGYYHSALEYTAMDSEDGIAIIGTRLSAIDVVLELAMERNIKGKLVMFSRSGSLPKIIGPAKEYELRYLKPEKLKQQSEPDGTVSLDVVMDLFKKEIEHAEGGSIKWGEVFSNTQSTSDSLKSEIDDVTNNILRPWQSVLIAVYPLVPWIWRLLSITDKKYFLRHYQSLWLTYLAAFPLKNAQRIYDLWVAGRVDIVGGFEELVKSGDKSFTVKTISGDYKFGAVINATGSGHQPYSQSELLAKLAERGISMPNELQDIPISPDTCEVITPTGDLVSDLYAIGETTFSTWFATADLGQVSRQAEKVVSTILA